MLVAETVQSETVLVGLGSVIRREREGERVRSVQSGGSGEEDDGRVCSAGARREKKRAEEEAAWLRWPTDGDGVKQTNPWPWMQIAETGQE
jgi:hypothetical protein